MKLEKIDWAKLPPIENSVDMGDTNASCFDKSVDHIDNRYLQGANKTSTEIRNIKHL